MKILFETQTQILICVQTVSCSFLCLLLSASTQLFVIILSVIVHCYHTVMRNVCGKYGKLLTIEIEKSKKVKKFGIWR